MKVDIITKDYVRDPTIFADIFNFYIYSGKQVIRPEQLTEKDSTELALPYGADGAVVPIQKFRDGQKLYTSMTYERIDLVLLGTENQAKIHYAMPVKNNLYDAVEYASQVEEAAKSHRKEMKEKKGEKPNSGEFLSGFWKRDKLIPSITLCLHLGAEVWDGPLSLFDMMDVSDPAILACMDNYHVRLISPALLSDKEIMKFQSSLREVMFFIKYSKDKEALSNILAANKERFQCLERRAADVIKAVTNLKVNYESEKEQVDMCQAVQDMCNESWSVGRAEGMEKGRAEGMEKGRAEGMEKGRAEGMKKGMEKGRMEALKNLMFNTGWPLEQALSTLGVPKDEWEKYAQLIAQ